MKKPDPHPFHKEQGFTLLEMAAVLAIIAVISGGILVGQTFIRASQLQGVISEYGQYQKAIKEFQDKYLALPGDMSNAESFWGTDPGTCPAASNTVAKVATCNGDGNGTIGSSSTDGSTLSNQTEWFRAWQQLSDAGMILGTFTGVAGANSATEAVPGVNVPKSKLANGGWTLMYYLQTATNGTLWGDQYGHILNFGAYLSGDIARSPILTPSEALNMDAKMDDGKPGRGIMRARRSTIETNCTTDTGTQDSQVYNTAYTSAACAPIFLMGF